MTTRAQWPMNHYGQPGGKRNYRQYWSDDTSLFPINLNVLNLSRFKKRNVLRRKGNQKKLSRAWPPLWISFKFMSQNIARCFDKVLHIYNSKIKSTKLKGVIYRIQYWDNSGICYELKAQ